ncbi:hypothetical protein Aduo_007317 [Ancylostoma duodenale]
MVAILLASLALLGCSTAQWWDTTTWRWYPDTTYPNPTESSSSASPWAWYPYRTSSSSSDSSSVKPSTWHPYKTSRYPTPTPSVTPASPLNQCSCTDKNIWLDVYFLIDASFAMTSAGFDGATAFVESVLFKMTLGQAYAQQTRVGFITYSADANKRYDLTSFRSTDDMINNADLTYEGSRGTNIEAAIQLASTSFDTSAHRDNAQKVIVIVASDYQKGSYNDPTVAAETFKEDGGYIITVEYLQEHGEPIPLLKTLASGPQFQFTNRFGNLTTEDIRTAFCKANCFCPTNYNPYNQGDIVPLGGCYRPVPISSIQVLAAKNCRQHHNAILAKVEDRSKAQFLSSLFPSKTKYWIGLKLINGVYQWPDGTTLQSNNYQMWAPGYPNSGAGECVYMYQYSGFSSGWFNDDCGDDQNYVCQNVPCSADNYCSTRT